MALLFFLICTILTVLAFFILYKITCNKIELNPRSYPGDYIGDYAISITSFIGISVIVIYTIVYLYIFLISQPETSDISKMIDNFNPYSKALIDSGLVFGVFVFIGGGIIKCIHKALLDMVFRYKTKKKKEFVVYKLVSAESSVIWLLICVILGCICLWQKQWTMGFTFFVIVFSFFFWLDNSIKEKIEEIRHNISRIYIYILLYTGITSLLGAVFPERRLPAFFGMVAGILLFFFYVVFIYDNQQMGCDEIEQTEKPSEIIAIFNCSYFESWGEVTASEKSNNSEIGRIGAVVDADLHHFKIDHFRVKELWRKKGIGRCLLNELLSVAVEKGCEQMFVYPKPESYEGEKDITIEEAYKIYKSLGFKFSEEKVDESEYNNEMVLSIKEYRENNPGALIVKES